MKFYDTHSHTIEHQAGGLLLSIEGAPPVPGGRSYAQWQQQKLPLSFTVVPYLHALHAYTDAPIIYIHPRRNGFAPQAVVDYLQQSKARIVVLDTFHKFHWAVDDYVQIVRRFPDKQFLLAHGGGYDLREFIQIVRYHANAWVDFSATQSIFGCTEKNAELDGGTTSSILHALAEPRIACRVLFGSDNPEFSQKNAVAFYTQMKGEMITLFNQNYERLIGFL